MLYIGIDLHRKRMTVSIRNKAGGVIPRPQLSTRRANVAKLFEQPHKMGGSASSSQKVRGLDRRLATWLYK